MQYGGGVSFEEDQASITGTQITEDRPQTAAACTTETATGPWKPTRRRI